MEQRVKDMFIGLLIFALELVLFNYLWRNNAILSAALGSISALVLLKWAEKEEKFLYLAGFILGPIYDLMLVPRGIWNYGNPTILNMPMWLPLAYGLGVILIVKIGKGMAGIFSGKTTIQKSL